MIRREDAIDRGQAALCPFLDQISFDLRLSFVKASFPEIFENISEKLRVPAALDIPSAGFGRVVFVPGSGRSARHVPPPFMIAARSHHRLSICKTKDVFYFYCTSSTQAGCTTTK